MFEISKLVSFRTILITQHSDVVLLGVLAVLFKTGHPGPTKVSYCMLNLQVFINNKSLSLLYTYIFCFQLFPCPFGFFIHGHSICKNGIIYGI